MNIMNILLLTNNVYATMWWNLIFLKYRVICFFLLLPNMEQIVYCHSHDYLEKFYHIPVIEIINSHFIWCKAVKVHSKKFMLLPSFHLNIPINTWIQMINLITFQGYLCKTFKSSTWQTNVIWCQLIILLATHGSYGLIMTP